MRERIRQARNRLREELWLLGLAFQENLPYMAEAGGKGVKYNAQGERKLPRYAGTRAGESG